jgi:hypothetical protein
MANKDKKKLVLRAVPLRDLDAVVGGRFGDRLTNINVDTGAIRNALTRLGTRGGLGGAGAVSAGTDCCPGPVSGTPDTGPDDCGTSKDTACKTDSVCMPCV